MARQTTRMIRISDCWIERARSGAGESVPLSVPLSQKDTIERSTPKAPEAEFEGSVAALAWTFLVHTEGESDPERIDPVDERIARIVSAIESLGITRYDAILGTGSFGTAALLADGRVLKLTTDDTEVQSGAVLQGKTLMHVARIYGAWFIQGVSATVVAGWNPETEESSYKKSRVGVLLLEKMDRGPDFDAYKRELNQIGKAVNDEKTRLKAFPGDLLKLGRKKARAHLLIVSKAIEADLRRRAEYGNPIAEDVAEALHELRSYGIYAIDVHPGNIGYDPEDGRFKIFDIGSSSPPEEPKAPTLKTPKVRRPSVPGAAPDIVVQEL